MPKKVKKQRMIRMRATKEKKEKDKNKIKQSVKINITTSGGGSGGSGIPSIPTPIYNSMQGQKTGENIEIKNLLKQLDEKQQTSINNLVGFVNNSLIPSMTQNNENNNTQIFEKQTRPKDTTGLNLFQRIKFYKNENIKQNNNPDIDDQALNINNGIDGDEIPEAELSLLSPPPPPQETTITENIKPEKNKRGRKPGTKNRSAREIDMEKYDKEQNRIQTRRMRLDSQKSKDI
jgi:hypothetical protein